MKEGREHGHNNMRRPSRRIIMVLMLTACYMIFEIIGGILSHSLALLADAGHMLSDVAALSISWFAFMIAKRPPTKKATYGYYRAEVIAALFNGLILLVVACFIVKEAFVRLMEQPVQVATGAMIGIGAGGLLINIIGLALLQRDKAKNINIRSAWLHLLFDALGSVVVVISGFLIYLFNFSSADAIGSIFIAILVFYSAANLIAETVSVLMERAPPHIDGDQVINELKAVKGILDVHDLHIWSITPGKEALSAHVIVEDFVDYDLLQMAVHKLLFDKFGIEHLTIQLEKSCTLPDSACERLHQTNSQKFERGDINIKQ